MYQIKSRFIETPCRKLTRLKMDFTDKDGLDDFGIVLYSLDPEEIDGAHIRCDFKVWQDQAAEIDKEAIRKFYMEGDHKAAEVEVNIIRVPRVTVRSAAVLKVDMLRDKLKAMAELKGEEVCETLLAKADLLEDNQPDNLLAGITGGKA